MEQPQSRAAFSPAEFAALFGKSPTWGYRQIYSGNVNAVSGQGRMMIPASEVERLTGKAAQYDGPMVPKKKVAAKPATAKAAPKTWREVLKAKRPTQKKQGESETPAPTHEDPRAAALHRLMGRKSGSSRIIPPQNGPS